MPAPHAFYSKMLAERTASRNVFVLFYLFYFIYVPAAMDILAAWAAPRQKFRASTAAASVVFMCATASFRFAYQEFLANLGNR
jgi:hypothetical protein